MAYSTADAELIARLKAATRAAKEIVAQAKAEAPVTDINRQNDRSVRARGRSGPCQPAINLDGL